MVLGTSASALTHKSLLLSRALNFSSRPITHATYHARLLPVPRQTTSIRFSSLHPFNSTHAHPLNAQLPFHNSRVSAVPDDCSGGTGGRWGSGGWNPGEGGDETAGGGGGGGGGEWCLLSCIVNKFIVKKLEPMTMNTLASSGWWAFGFYCTVVGGQAFLEGSLFLDWLTVVFLAFDVFFVILCIGMACIVFFALLCITPTIAFAYDIRTREGASEQDIRSLPKYRFSQSNSLVMVDDNKKQARIDSYNGSHISELSLHPDDSECCICLSPYVDGAELYRLPCTHHFHCGCISRWLRTKATCPLCKFNILRGVTLV